MAFDAYVGTMTRFYRRDWQNVVQRMALEKGIQYNMIYAGGEPEPPEPAEVVRQAVTGWCSAITQGLRKSGCGTIGWSEGDELPYFTDRPGWEGYSGLLLMAAYAEHPDLPLPKEIPASWLEDPALQRSLAPEFSTKYRTILEPQIWLPNQFDFVFAFETLASEAPEKIGSVFCLKRQLEELRSNTSRLFSETPNQRRGLLANWFGRKSQRVAQEPTAFSSAARHGLDVFYDLADKACQHRLPMLLNY